MWSHSAILVFATCFLHIVNAITITNPYAGQDVDLTKPYTIRWNHTKSDPAQLSIDIVNKTAVPGEVSTLDNLAHYIEVTAGEVAIQWPASISNETESYQLIFIDTPTGAPFAQSGIFNLLIPPGESRNATLGTTGAVGPHTAPSTNLSRGAIAGIVIGVLFAVSTLLTILFLFLRRRHRLKLQTNSSRELKNELDGVATTSGPRAELSDQKGLPRAELPDEKTDFLKFELPSTPPHSPTELSVPEIPAAEMPAGRPPSSYLSARNLGDPLPKGPLSETSHTTDSTLVVAEPVANQHAIARKPVPVSRRIAEEEMPRMSREDQPLSPSVSLPERRPEGASADAQSLYRMRLQRAEQTEFQAALHELVSRELRRPGP